MASLNKEEMIEIILEMYDNRKEVKEYLNYYLEPNEIEQFEKYKKIIKDEYYPKRGEPKIRLAVCKKAISEFSKLHPSPELEAELMICLVVYGSQFTNEYGDMWDQYYTGMATNYERALKFASKHSVLDRIKPQAKQCLEYASICGWGFCDDLSNTFHTYYQE